MKAFRVKKQKLITALILGLLLYIVDWHSFLTTLAAQLHVAREVKDKRPKALNIGLRRLRGKNVWLAIRDSRAIKSGIIINLNCEESATECQSTSLKLAGCCPFRKANGCR